MNMPVIDRESPPSPATTPEKPGHGKWIAIGAGSAVVVIFVVLLVVGALVQTTSKTLVSANFNNGKGPFSTDTDPTVTMQFIDGGYRMLLKQPGPQVARYFFDTGTVNAVRIEADAVVRNCAGSCAVAVGAWNGHSAQYMLAYSREAGAALLKEPDASTGAKQVLAESRTPPSDRVHLVLEVRGGGATPTTLVGWVNGHELRANDAAGYDSFAGIGLWVAGDKAPVDVLWDNVSAKRR